MGGGLIQLVSQGFEDLYLTSDPEITFFKRIYKRHTNFSLELIPQLFGTNPNFGKRVTCNISKNADLLSNIYIYIQLPSIPKLYDNENQLNDIDSFAWTKKIGYSIINYVELEIGGQLIDKQYGDWLNIWSELTETLCKNSIDKMIGNVKENFLYTNGKNSYNLYIPLKFWFCRHKGLALPIVALHFSEIKIHVEFNKLKDILISSPTNFIEIDENVVHFKKNDILTQSYGNKTCNVIFSNYDYETKRLYYIKYNQSISSFSQSTSYNKESYRISNAEGFFVNPKNNSVEGNHNITIPELSIVNSYLLVNYIFLDNEEREKFAKSKHEYLIDFIQFSGEKTINNSYQKFKLGFSHPCKELIWVSQINNIKSGNIKDKYNYTDNLINGEGLIKKSRLLLNGQERSSFRNSVYYNSLNSYKYHSNSPEPGINLYSFSNNPENTQPTGSCNFSKIDDIVLEVNVSSDVNYLNTAKLRIYNHAYNIFRILNGLGGLAFSN